VNNVSLFIALRYFKSKRKGFVSIISGIAFAGIALAVAVLIVVTSVMNGFEKELQNRILQAIPHASIVGNIKNNNVKNIIDAIGNNSNIEGAAPYIETQGLLTTGSSLKGVYIYGVDPHYESTVSIVNRHIISGTWDSLNGESYNVLIGDILANQLGLVVGDKVNMLVPDTNLGLAGILPRTRQFVVSGIFSVGAPEIDQAHVYLNLTNASKLLRLDDSVHGIRIRYSDLFSAPTEVFKDARVINELFSLNLYPTSWTQSYGTLFKAIKNEKFLISLLLSFIVLVAVFNVVAMLVMVVNEKKGQIAVLTTLGASKNFILSIFLYFGTLIGATGTFVGVLSGLLISYYLGSIINFLELILGVKFLEVYFIDYFPIDMRFNWIFCIGLLTMLLTSLCSLYPAKIASNIEPAEVLKYE